jgi:hypothetical protein
MAIAAKPHLASVQSSGNSLRSISTQRQLRAVAPKLGGQLGKTIRAQTKKTAPPAEQVARDLLEPILGFLAASGMTRDTASSAFDTAWQAVGNEKSKVRINRLPKIDLYGDLVGIWTRHPDYIDRHGRPRDLAMRGMKGFQSLVAVVDASLAADQAASVLLTYGNVSKLRNGRYRLLKSFFHVRTRSAVAFEPSARFLADASATVNCLIHPSSASASPGLFWRVADTPNLSEEHMQSYLEYARRRSLVFLQEIDDWLQAHVGATRASKSRGRAGLGIFSICSVPREVKE